MSDLVVLTFESEEDAAAVRGVVRSLQKAGQIALNDAAVVSKDAEGKLHVRDELDAGVKVGAMGGAVVGVFLSFVFPIVGLVAGVATGALMGKLADTGVDKSFIKELGEKLEPGSSALFLVVRDGEADSLRAALSGRKGEVYHTSLPPSFEEELRAALSGPGAG